MNIWITIAETFLGIQRSFWVKDVASIQLWDLAGSGQLKCKTMSYCNTMRQTQLMIITLLFSWSFKSWNNFCAGRHRSATRTWLVCCMIWVCAFLQMIHLCQSNVLNCFTLDRSSCFFQWKIMLMFLFKSNVYCPSSTRLLKVEFLILLKVVNFWGVLFCGFFFCGN